ncbi:hypothetical protein LSAT2_012835 [Lamellibrachia satsuma]|nr:hypothetical protein LSAT2_012835 [Lamellibrachia satsuma]
MWRRISARAKDRLRFVYRANAAGVYNQAITVRGHQADIVKADIMVKYGGILMDPDILMTRRLKDDLFRYETVVGLDFMPFPPFPDTLNMGICLCMPNAPFGRLWQQSQRNFNDSLWTWNSNQVTYKLLERHPRTAFIERHLQVICYMYHCHPTWLPRLVYQTVNTTYNTIQNLTNWKKDVFSVHFTAPICRLTKLKIFGTKIESILIYGCDSWSLTQSVENALVGTYTRMLQKTQNVSWRHHMTNQELYGSLPRITTIVRQRRLRLVGHVMHHDVAANKALLWKPDGEEIDQQLLYKTY